MHMREVSCERTWSAYPEGTCCNHRELTVDTVGGEVDRVGVHIQSVIYLNFMAVVLSFRKSPEIVCKI